MFEKVQQETRELPIDWDSVTREDAQLYLSVNGLSDQTREKLKAIIRQKSFSMASGSWR